MLTIGQRLKYFRKKVVSQFEIPSIKETTSSILHSLSVTPYELYA